MYHLLRYFGSKGLLQKCQIREARREARRLDIRVRRRRLSDGRRRRWRFCNSPSKTVPLGLVVLVASAMLALSCGQEFRDLSTANGRQAVLDLANNYLTEGKCDEALSVMSPLMVSRYVDNDARMVYASAYACKGGLNFPSMLVAVKNVSGSDIWTPLVSSNYSANKSDNHITNLSLSSDVIRQTAVPMNSLEAQYRSADANMYMIFVQANIISSLISVLGSADPSTGHRRQNMCAVCATTDQCLVQVAFSTIADSLLYVPTGSALDTVRIGINAACGGACPTNRDFTTCGSTPAYQAQGQVLINAINSQWST